MKEKIKMIIFILILGTILTAVLVAVNDYTFDIIKQNNKIKTQKNILKVFNLPYSENNIDKIFQNNISEKIIKDKKFYINNKTGDIAFKISGNGFQGEIISIVAIYPDLETILGLTIVQQVETPGLGGRISEQEFLDQFKNKKFSPQIKFMPKGKAKKENEVDQITGATISCNELEKIINKQGKKFISIYKGVDMSPESDTHKQ